MERDPAHVSPSELAPMRIGEILDKSVSVFKQVFYKALVPFGVLAVFQTIQQANAQHPLPVYRMVGGLAAIFAAMLSIIVYFAALFLASDHWLGRSSTWGEAFSRVRFRFFWRMLAISLIVGLVAMIPILILVFGTIAFGVAAKSISQSPGTMLLLFLVGGVFAITITIGVLVYFANRVLAYYIAVLEDQKAFDALGRSKFLMSQGAWYSLKSPWMRVTGLFLVTLTISIAISIVAVAAQAGKFAGLPLPLTYSFIFLAAMLSNAVYVFNTIAMTGFYYDLRVRYEAFGLGRASGTPQPQASSAAYMWLERNSPSPTRPG